MTEDHDNNPVLARALETLARTEPTGEDLAEQAERARQNNLERIMTRRAPEMVRVRNEDALVPAAASAPIAATRAYVEKQIVSVRDALVDRLASRREMAALEARIAALEAAADKPRVRVPAGSAARS